MGDKSGSGHGWDDHVGEAGDFVGNGVTLAQGADAGGMRGFAKDFLPADIMYGMDDAGNALDEGMRVANPGVSNLFNGVGAATSAFGAVTGGLDAFDDSSTTRERLVGGANAINGIVGTASSIASMGEASLPFVKGLGSAAGLGSEVSMASFGIGAGSATGAAAVGSAVATGSSVLGAGLAGYGLGTYADEHSADTGWFKDSAGRNQTMSGEVADAGVAADGYFENAVGGKEGSFRHGLGDIMGDIAGLATVGGGTILGTMAAPTIAAHGLGSAALGVGSSFMNWCRGATK